MGKPFRPAIEFRRITVVTVVLFAALQTGAAHAADYSVTTTADTAGTCAPAGPCSLRQAINSIDSAPAPPDRVLIPAGPYSLDSGQPLVVSADMTIAGAGARSTTVAQLLPADRSTEGERVFDVAAGATVTISGLTVTGGTANPANNFFGGDIRSAGNLTLTDSQITNGSAYSGGGVSNNNGTMLVERTTVTGNSAPFGGGDSGGIQNFGDVSTGHLTLRNSTVEHNQARVAPGVFSWGGNTGNTVTITSSTIASNTATGGTIGGLGISEGAGNVRDTIIAGNDVNGSPRNCDDGPNIHSLGHNLESGSDCEFTASGDLQKIDPQLGTLQNNGGPTDTLAIGATSPAFDAGSTDCPPTDQRGEARPQGAACDIGAFELFVPPPPPPPPPPAPLSLELSGAGTELPGDTHSVVASLHRAADPSAGGPLVWSVQGANPAGGTITTGSDGKATISWTGKSPGTDTLTVFADANQNGVRDGDEPISTQTVEWLAMPVVQRTANVEPVSGTVLIRLANGSFVPLGEAQTIPLGTTLDATHGRVAIQTAVGSADPGAAQRGEFYGGVFQVGQTGGTRRPVSEMVLAGALQCQSARGKLAPAARRSRRLWGHVKGRFRTRGRFSTATVRGTLWLTKDSCNTTTTVVRSGTVVVRDLTKRKNVTVRRGHRYVARARRH